MELGLKNKVAVVCASSRGMGKAIALELALEGCHIAICARGVEALEKTREEIKSKSNATVFAVQLDVTDPAASQKFIDDVVRKFGTIHILVNNAGGPPTGTFLDIPDEEWQKALNTNLLSTIFWSKHVIPYMKKQKWGRIINITSLTIKQPLDGFILSSTTRAGIIGFSKTIARELASHNILINNIAPGIILTHRIQSLAEHRSKKDNIPVNDILEKTAQDIPMTRMGTPEEIAHLAVFLASEKASYITGTTIQVDGGLYRGLL